MEDKVLSDFQARCFILLSKKSINGFKTGCAQQEDSSWCLVSFQRSYIKGLNFGLWVLWHPPLPNIVHCWTVKWLLTIFCAIFQCFCPRSTTVPMIISPWVSALYWGKNADRIIQDSYRQRSEVKVNTSAKVHIQEADFSFTMEQFLNSSPSTINAIKDQYQTCNFEITERTPPKYLGSYNFPSPSILPPTHNTILSPLHFNRSLISLITVSVHHFKCITSSLESLVHPR